MQRLVRITMNMYIALVCWVLAAWAWPSRNPFDTPFSELTLGTVFRTIVSLYLWFYVFLRGFESLSEDKFWPWRWTLDIVKSLAARIGMLAVLFGGYWVISEDKKFGALLYEWPILTGIIVFVAMSWIVLMPDEEIFGPKPNNNPAPPEQPLS
jgi:hypothetical protein